MNALARTACLILLFINDPSLAQSFDDCKASMIFISAEKSAVFNGSLQNYFEQALQNKIDGRNGSIGLTLLIDTSGTACCRSIDNKTGSDISTLNLQSVISAMPAWQPAIQNQHKINFSPMLFLDFNERGLTVRYANEKVLMAQPLVNKNKTNKPEIHKDRKTKSTWKAWTFSNSMIPGNMSRKVAMDSKGIIWYCTDNGLVRIDGENWQVFNGMNTPALAGKNQTTWTTELAIDRFDNIWVSSFDQVLKYDGKNWMRYDSTDAPLYRFKRIYVDNNGNIWSRSSAGLSMLDGEEWKLTPAQNPGLTSTFIREIYVDAEKSVWIASDSGIFRLRNNEWTRFYNGNITSCIKGDKAGNIWAGTSATANNVLIKIQPDDQMYTYPSAVIWNLQVDPTTQHIWISSRGSGLMNFDGNIFETYTTANSIIPHNTVTSVCIDKNGDKWVSTFGGLLFTTLK